MISLKKREQGFTIVELLIVIVVIGILAALVITTYTGIQAKARNGKRQTDINSVQTQIEAFFQEQGYYPAYGDLSNASWDTSNLKSLDQTALHDPSASGSAITLANSAPAASNAKTYYYQPTDSSGASCETDHTTCAKYTLTAVLETSGDKYQKTNLD